MHIYIIQVEYLSAACCRISAFCLLHTTFACNNNMGAGGLKGIMPNTRASQNKMGKTYHRPEQQQQQQ